MSKVIPVNLAAHYALGTTTLAYSLKITRVDEEVYAFTSFDADVTIAGVLYQSGPGLNISEIVTSAGLAVDNLELSTLDDGSTFTALEVLSGVWRNAAFEIGRFNYVTPADGIDVLLTGTLGNVQRQRGVITAELRGLQQYLQQPIGNITSKTCRARLGDSLCRVALGPYSTIGTVVAVTNNQTFSITDPWVPPGDPDYASVTLQWHGEAVPFADSGPLASTYTVQRGTAQLSASQFVYGAASLYFDGNTKFDLVGSTPWTLPGDFTMEARVRFTAFKGTQMVWIFGTNGNLATSAGLSCSTGIIGFWSSGSRQITGPTLSLNTWYHIALVRSSGVVSLYVDGVSVGTPYAYATSVSVGTAFIADLGNNTSGTTYTFVGYLDELRFTKGVARYTANFTPAAQAFYDAVGPATGYFDTAKPADYYAEGVITFTSGANAGLSQKVKTHIVGNVLSLSLPMLSTVAPGDALSIYGGCRKRLAEDCIAKFNNVLNFQGEPHLPGIDALTAPPA